MTSALEHTAICKQVDHVCMSQLLEATQRDLEDANAHASLQHARGGRGGVHELWSAITYPEEHQDYPEQRA